MYRKEGVIFLGCVLIIYGQERESGGQEVIKDELQVFDLGDKVSVKLFISIGNIEGFICFGEKRNE